MIAFHLSLVLLLCLAFAVIGYKLGRSVERDCRSVSGGEL